MCFQTAHGLLVLHSNGHVHVLASLLFDKMYNECTELVYPYMHIIMCFQTAADPFNETDNFIPIFHRFGFLLTINNKHIRLITNQAFLCKFIAFYYKLSIIQAR